MVTSWYCARAKSPNSKYESDAAGAAGCCLRIPRYSDHRSEIAASTNGYIPLTAQSW
jgi:hypothetical protein